MIRILSTTFLFLAVVCIASDCQAQRRGGFFQRHLGAQHAPVIQQRAYSSQAISTPVYGSTATPVQIPFATAHSPFTPKPIEFGRYSTYRNPLISKILDGPTTKYRDPAEVNSRYIGGFHQSHFDNIGIPSGDIGIRGNAYQWRTW